MGWGVLSNSVIGCGLPSSRTSKSFCAYLRRLGTPSHEGRLVVHRVSGDLVGVINVSEIVRGVLRSAYLGYYGFAPYVGHGYMLDAPTFGIPVGIHPIFWNAYVGAVRIA